MKKLIFSISIVLLCQYSFAQTPYPCTLSFSVINNSNGGQGCPPQHPADPNYDRDGVLMIRFSNAIGTTVEAPAILTIQRQVNGVLEPAADMKYVVKSFASDRKSVEYCFYSVGNTNLFNGAGALYVFTIQYAGLAAQVCDPVAEGSPTLPVKFASFIATKNTRGVSLKWETAAEENNTGFYVERKLGSAEWSSLAFIPSRATNGFSSSNIAYAYDDAVVSTAIIQYRLRQVDADGKSAYSEIRSVRLSDELSVVTVFPNPSHGNVSVVVADQTTLHNIRIVDVAGRTVKSADGVKSSQEFSGLKRGQYMIMVTNTKTSQTVSEKFIVQ